MLLLFIGSQAMRVTLIVALAPLVMLLGALPGTCEEIKSFESTIEVKPQSTLSVSERLVVDFGTHERHGILRFIPVEYRRAGGRFTVDLSLKKVTDGAGQPLTYTAKRQGQDLVVKIGDSYRTITGEHVYKIDYTVRRAVNFFQNGPEIYWNVTGDESTLPIAKAVGHVILPEKINVSSVRTDSFVGPYGSTKRGQISARNNVLTFEAANLAPREGLTLVAGLPKNSIEQPSQIEEFLWFWADWWPMFVFPAGTFWILGLLYWFLGRDALAPLPVGVEWSPPRDLTPAEVGTLVDESCDMEDIVSTLIDLAARGYIKIRETISNDFLFFSRKDYVFTRLPEPQGDRLSPHEREFLDALFYRTPVHSSTRLSDLREKFYVHLPTIKSKIYESLVGRGMFNLSPEEVRNGWYLMSGVLLLAGLACAVGEEWRSFGLGLMASGLIILCFARAMPARTRKGCEALYACKSFQRFVKLAEKERIRVLAKDDPTIFGRLLPYAMVLGAADQWAEAFKDLLAQPPEWFEPYGYGTGAYNFSTSAFVSDLGSGMRSMEKTFASAPQSTSSAGGGGSGFSGGFSGGGFGGGGTSSW